MASGEFKFAGSAFYLGEPIEGGKAVSVCLVTARHVIDGIRNLGVDKVYIRYNDINGTSNWLAHPISNWKFHPSDAAVDVAVMSVGIPSNFDHLAIATSMVATDVMFKQYEIGIGDEVFVTGLFRHHFGTKRNVPIVRVGNIAAMRDEKVQVKSFGDIDAYLIEARSIGGISGSPVFVNLGSTRRIGESIVTGGLQFLLLGLIHGHYDVNEAVVDGVCADEQNNEKPRARINSGIAIVVPIEKILEVKKSACGNPLFTLLACANLTSESATLCFLDGSEVSNISITKAHHLF